MCIIDAQRLDPDASRRVDRSVGREKLATVELQPLLDGDEEGRSSETPQCFVEECGVERGSRGEVANNVFGVNLRGPTANPWAVRRVPD